ncbi:energy transducer TonB [Solimonas soli]|uniref:energy transducer TonB n=1 Tax=Solimonas soli TaxID=413479 RepID=UPI0006887145|nr:energy transducer TonB [Solimonas soli]
MTASLAMPSYLRTRRAIDPRHAAAFGLIAALHVAALAALFIARDAPRPPQAIQPMMVTFISEAPPRPEPAPPPPETLKPKPQPKMIATPKPTPAAITAPPLDEPTVDERPVEQAPPTPAPAAPAAPPETVPPNFVAAYLNNPGPKYPQMSMKLREQGTVMLLVLVSAEGRADKVTVESSSGHSRLDDAAIDVVKRYWRFVPAKQGDKAVAAWVKVPITFELNQKR